MLCLFAQHACSPLLQGFLFEEELQNNVILFECSLQVSFRVTLRVI